MPGQQRLWVNMHLPSAEQVAMAVQLGAYGGRVDFCGDLIWPEPDRFDWTQTDDVVANMKAAGLDIYATVAYTPSWMSGHPSRYAPPIRAWDWGRLMEAVVSRYQDRVRIFGAWNEPNKDDFWLGGRRDYQELIVRPMREVATRLGVGLAGPEISTQGDWPQWLGLCLQDVGNLFDYLTVHCYGKDGLNVWRKLTRERDWIWETPCVQEVIEDAGFEDKPCWVTECGFPSRNGGEATQADAVDQILEKILQHSWPAGLVYYQLQDEPPSPSHPEGVSYGLFDVNGHPKPAADVFSRHARS